MRWKRLKFYSRLNIFILAVLLLLGFSAFYFVYYRQRSQADMFVAVTLMRPLNMPTNAPFNWVPYWVGDSIHAGDTEKSPLGGVNTVVAGKEIADGPSYGQYVYLLLRVRAIRDRSGVYLFKNKPLSTGGTIDLKLTNTQVQGLVMYIGKEPPQYEEKAFRMTIKGREVEPWLADSVKVGSTIQNAKGMVVAKVIDKRVTPAEVRADAASGVAVTSYDQRKRDLEVVVEITTKKIGESYYFSEIQKVKPNEVLYLPFPEISLNLPIISVQ